MNKTIEKVLLYLFLALALAAIICYFAISEDRTYFYYCGGAAIVVRGMHYVMKYFI